MRADEPHIDDSIGIIDPHHNAILVAGDVEHRTAVLENARAADVVTNIDAWFAELDRFADVPFMDGGRQQPPMPAT